MHYQDVGSGPPTVFLHGNPTSSFLWRRVLPALPTSAGRLIAVDLIGMGRSGKPDIAYRLADHIRYVEAFVDALGLTEITFVAHDWGVAISLDYLRRHPDRVRGLAFMEGHVRPISGWADFDPGGRAIFADLRTPGLGERMVLTENFFLDTLLPAAINRTLTAQEWAEYRDPYPDPMSRRPLLAWAREIPIAGQPPEVAATLTEAWDHFAGSSVHKLLIYAHPGAVLGADAVAWCRRTVPDLQVADLGAGTHFLPEERPTEIAEALARWFARPGRPPRTT